MAKGSSAKQKGTGFVGGTALYQERAAQALPLLVRQAKVHQPGRDSDGFASKLD